jgi:hypothetical protein
MHERGIHEDRVKSTVRDPDMTEPGEDSEVHYQKNPEEWGKRPAGYHQPFRRSEPGHHYVL